MRKGRPAALVLALWGALALGQGTIYESQGPLGPVFSDQPSPGATQVILPPPNVVAPEHLVPALPVSRPPPGDHQPLYSSVGISSPANGDTIHTNTGTFDVRVEVVPELRDGDRIELRLDGTPLQRVFRAGTISLTEADWQAAAAEDVRHSLQAAVVSSDAAVLAESAVVSFYAHRATVKRRRR